VTFLAPLFFVGLAAIAVPILVHLIQRERRDVVEFPSLMFLRRIPYQSVERRRIHNWPLLLLRIGAIALVATAFARPFFAVDPVRAAAALSGAREVVILLDRSASMGYGDHWRRAQAEARKVVATLQGEDRATLVLFGTGAEEAVRATGDKAQLERAIDAATVSADGTRFAPALRWAQTKLTQSALPRREAVLISDFQKAGWERQEDIRLPEGATLAPISVAEYETTDLAVSSVAFQRASFQREERVTVTAGLTNRSARAVTAQPVTLEIDGQVFDTRPVTIGPNASGAVTFLPVTASALSVRGRVRAGTDPLPADNTFHFVLSPSRPVSVLIVQAEGAAASASDFVTTALSIGSAPPFAAEIVSASRLAPQHLERRSVVVLNDASALSTQADEALARFATQGGGVLVVLGARSPWNAAEPALLPGRLGAPVDRLRAGGTTLGFLDYAHPIWDEFKDPRNGNFSNARFYQYRALAPSPTDRVLARFADGAPAMVERTVGAGHVIALTSTVDDTWNDFPKRPLFLPLVHETVRYLAQYAEPEAWYTVGRSLDISVPIAAIVREGAAVDAQAGPRRASGVVMAPSGAQTTIGEGAAPSVLLAEQGFYSVRLQGTGDRRPFHVAVNLDPAESDLSPLQPEEFVKAATGRPAARAAGQSLEAPEETPADVERKQSYWWFLLLAAAALLLAEGTLANRQSRRFAWPEGAGRTG
jgi:hypothetical protein